MMHPNLIAAKYKIINSNEFWKYKEITFLFLIFNFLKIKTSLIYF